MSVRKNLLEISILAFLIVSLTMVSVVISSPEPVFDVDPPVNSGMPTTTFTINVTVADITLEESLNGWDFGISFNSSILNAISVQEGPFLKDAGFTWFTPYINNDAYPENTTGLVGAMDRILGSPATGAYGSGVLANITFQVIAEGKTYLPMYYTALGHWNGTATVPVEHTKLNGWFLSVFTMLGDIDGDSSVDSQDLELFASSYGTKLGDPNFNWLADLDRDSVVESYDLYLLAQNYDT